jgi:hypothetical protein
VGPVPLGSVPSDGVPPDDGPEVGAPEVGVFSVDVGADATEVGELDGSESPRVISDKSSAQAVRSNKGGRT